MTAGTPLATDTTEQSSTVSKQRNSLRRSTYVLITGFSLIMCLMIGVVWLGLSYMNQAQQVLSTVVEKNLTKTNLFNELKGISQARTITLFAMAGFDDAFERDELLMQFNALAGEFIGRREILTRISADRASKTVLNVSGGLISQAIAIQQSVLDALADNKHPIDIKDLIRQAVRAQDLVRRSLTRLAELELDASNRELEVAQKNRVRTKYGLIAITGIAVMIGLITLYIVLLIIRNGERALGYQAKSLELANNELCTSNNELEQFAYAASHDLQEPLRTITSFLQLLEQNCQAQINDDGRKYMAFALDGSDRMRKLIEGLLAFSRVGKSDMSVRPVDSGHALASALANLELVIADSGSSINFGMMPQVLADENQLGQLFQNLVSNAIKYHDQFAPIIDISVKLNDKRWQISVADNGIGIQEKHFERIFQIFQRLHSRSEYSGVGIGLAMCKKIVEYHGGQLWVESTVGQGSIFHFTLEDATDTAVVPVIAPVTALG